jgi:Uma2 family endonuclease
MDPGKPMLLPPRPRPASVKYPDSDGKPLGETDFHISAILHLRSALRRRFYRDERVYVAADMLLYYEEGNPAARRAPDVFVVKGVGNHDRRSYKLWVEKIAPCVVIEVSSPETWLEDKGDKRAIYEAIGVREYYLFDPLGEYLAPRLQGFELAGGSYRPVEPIAAESIRSAELGLVFRAEGSMLRVVDPVTGEVVPTLDEAVDRAEAEARRAEAEARRAARAEAELARLQAEIEKARRATEEGGSWAAP